MTSFLFLAADAETPIVSNTQPLLNSELRCVSAAYITPGAPKSDFFKSKRFILVSEDDALDLSATLYSWIAVEPPLYIFAFDAPHILRRIAAYCVAHKVNCLPAYYWCGIKSRAMDMCFYLTGENETTARELLKASGIEIPAYYEPHLDSIDDLKYLLSLADKYSLIKAKIEENAEEIPLIQPEAGEAVMKLTRKVTMKKAVK
jgi:hypothetical protein